MCSRLQGGLPREKDLFGRAERGVLNATSNAAADDDNNDDDDDWGEHVYTTTQRQSHNATDGMRIQQQ